MNRSFPLALRNRAALDYFAESQLGNSPSADFFELIPLGSDGLILVLGDVAGQSTAASALVVAGLRAALRTGLLRNPTDIKRVVRDLNVTLCDAAPDSFYVTLFCAVIEPAGREVHYVNAGHQAALLLRAGTQRAHRLESTGTVLGLTTRSAYGMRTIALEPGDLLAAFSDTVVDAADSAGRAFGEAGILACLRDHAGVRAIGIVEGLLDAVRRFFDPAAPPPGRTAAVVQFRGSAATPLLERETEEPAFAA